MICRDCGATIPDESQFCNKCGKRAVLAGEPERQMTPIERIAEAQEKEQQGERELWEGRLSWKAYGGWFLLLLLLLVLFLAFFATQCIKGNPYLKWIGYIEAIIWVGLFGWLVVKVLRVKLSRRYRLTTERLFVERGLISKTVDEIELIRVDDVAVHQNIIQRMFNVGDVTVIAPTDASDTNLVLQGIEDPIEVKEKIREYTQRRRKKSLHIESV